jgi:hypothetical protein
MRRRGYYVLDGHEPRAVDTVEEWAAWYEEAKRRVDFTDLGFCTVSTVFLGVDHNFWGKGPPILFETMVFANPVKGEAFPEELGDLSLRYATWDEAEAGHADMVAEVRRKFWRRQANGGAPL